MTMIQGECVSPTAHAAVTISDLAAGGCRVSPATPRQQTLRPGECELWIGAVGPFAITVTPARRGRFTARFKHPLEAAVLAHFRS